MDVRRYVQLNLDSLDLEERFMSKILESPELQGFIQTQISLNAFHIVEMDSELDQKNAMMAILCLAMDA